MNQVAKNSLNRPSIVQKISDPLNHELEHFSHCMINSPFLENSGIIPDYKNNFRQKLQSSTVESGFEGHFWINVASFTKLLTIKVKSSMYKHKSKVEGLRLLKQGLKIPKLGCDQIFTLPASSLLLVSSFTLVGLKDSNSFLDLSLERVLVLQHVDQLGVVDLEQHASDLASQVREHPLDEREESLTQHLLLLLWRGSCQHGCSEWLLALDQHSLLRRGSSSWGHHLARHHLWVELSWRVPGSGSVLEALLGSDLLGSHGDWGHARSGHHGHGLRAGLPWGLGACQVWPSWSWAEGRADPWGRGELLPCGDQGVVLWAYPCLAYHRGVGLLAAGAILAGL